MGERFLVLSGARVDRHTGDVLGVGAPAVLTDTERRLLEYLAARPGVAVSREELLAEVWGFHPRTVSRAVDTAVRRLRRKLGAARHHLETVRHVGYRFRVDVPRLAHGDTGPTVTEANDLAALLREGRLRAAERRASTLAADPHACVDAACVLAEIALTRGHWDDARRHAAEAERLAVEAGDAALTDRVRGWRIAIGDAPAPDRTGVPPSVGQAIAHSRAGRWREAEEALRAVQDRAIAAGDVHAECHAQVLRGTVLAQLGRRTEARAALTSAMVLARTLGDVERRGDALAGLGLIDLEEGHRIDARERLGAALSVLQGCEAWPSVALVEGALGLAAAADQQTETAIAYLASARARCGRPEDADRAAFLDGALAVVRALAGEPADAPGWLGGLVRAVRARRGVEEAIAAAPEPRGPLVRCLGVVVRRAVGSPQGGGHGGHPPTTGG